MNNQKDFKLIIDKKLQIFLNLTIKYINSIDRIKIVFGLFIIYSLIIITTAFNYSVFEYSYYSKLAEGQQTRVIKNTVNRGTIYSNNDPVGVLATSTDLSDFAVDPTQAGSLDKLQGFLIDIIYGELCTGNQVESCEENLSSFLKIQSIDEFSFDPEFIKGKIADEVKKRLSKKMLDFISLKENISDKEKFDIMLLGNEALVLQNSNLFFDFNKNTDKTQLGENLTKILKIPQIDIQNKLKAKEIRYIKFLTKLSLITKDKIDARIENEKNAIKKGLLEEKNSIYNFIILEPRPTRFFPEKTLASQVLGFVDNEGQGKYGIEGYYNEELQGQEGLKITKKDISGKPLGLDELSEKKMIHGSDIKLTIDRNIQKEIGEILEKGVKDFKANKGSVLVMDPKTGAIIAMASYPDFDPNNFGDVYELEKVNYGKYPNPGFDLLGMPLFVEDSGTGGTDLLKYDGKMIKLRLANEKEIINNAIPKYKYKNNFGPLVYLNDTISSLYEPGSVFKAITTAIGIDTGDIKPGDIYNDKGFVEIDTFKIKNVSKECMGYNTYAHALNWSCNVGMIDIVKKIGSALFFKYINDFGFGQKTNITLEGEVFGKIQPYEKWSRAKLFTQSFGQGITATVLQMASAYSTIANGGIYMQPYIVDTITLPNGQTIKNAPTPLRRVIKEETSKKLVAMLTEGATVGFAKKGSVEGYDIAGKTGTSQIAAKGKYEQDGPGHTITSYGGFGPSSNPKFVMIVKIERPRSAEFSETTSSALFSQIAKYLLNYYAIPKSK